jgi:hypothetical protein
VKVVVTSSKRTFEPYRIETLLTEIMRITPAVSTGGNPQVYHHRPPGLTGRRPTCYLLRGSVIKITWLSPTRA